MGENARGVSIDRFSGYSLYLKLFHEKEELGTATGFLVAKDSNTFLITNYHVLSGLRADDNSVISQQGLRPDRVHIWHHVNDKLTERFEVEERIVNEHWTPLWISHTEGTHIDVVALPLTKLGTPIETHPLPLELIDADVMVYPSMAVSIIGFPLGLTAHFFWPVWKTGNIASEPEINVDGLPMFLIDATTRGGMSGSPVIARVQGAYMAKSGGYVMGGIANRFLGVYSGRIRKDSEEIGRVWKASVIEDILASVGQ